MIKVSRLIFVVAIGFGLSGCNRQTEQPVQVTLTAATTTSTPSPAITVESWSRRITEVKGETVHINLGDRAGVGGDDDARTALWLLDYSLNAHPKASVFIVHYSYTVAMGTDELQLVYNRKKKTFGTKSGGRGKPVIYDKPPMKGINDEAIHTAAIGFGSYYDIKPLQSKPAGH